MWFLLLYGLLAFGIAWLGRNRKFGFWGYFVCALIFSPVTGLIAVLASDVRRPEPSLNETLVGELQSISESLRHARSCGVSEPELEALQVRLDSVGRLIRVCK